MSKHIAFIVISVGLLICYLLFSSHPSLAQQIPHGQSKPPNEPRTAEEALKFFKVPAGFSVEIVAAEPDIVNPVAMTFDERGRIWVTESLEYPRREPGRGRDRVKILEDTTGDGKIDKTTIFAEGLNIPSGIAVGYGGVWVANSPDLLFMQDTDGDDKADKVETVLSGFGRTDTHELPNSLTWGPDGYLYGLNGVFNYSDVTHKGRQYKFTCAMFRIDPRTRDFELFAEGTSNPWGIAWDPLGNAFVSACVIDHLWHLTETGYYLRQGGPYPPFVWQIGSIVDHLHQQRAYCGIHYFDSDAYPEEYRDRLYMGNIHGNCLNVDRLRRKGATYFAEGEPDFLSANDSWFMPVVQKTGPDGCLYVLDWYDRYHCYQDANRDPQGIDRLKGRLYRIRYQDSPRAKPFDLRKESNDELLARLSSPNVFYRDLAQRVLAERQDPSSAKKLQALVLDDAENIKYRLHALWALIGAGPLDADFLKALLDSPRAELASWGVRAAGNHRCSDREICLKIASLANAKSPDVRLQVAIAAVKLEQVDALRTLLTVLKNSGDDKLIPHIVWENLHPLIGSQTEKFVSLIAPTGKDASKEFDLAGSESIQQLAPLIVDRILAIPQADPLVLTRLITKLAAGNAASKAAATKSVDMLVARIRSGELDGEHLEQLKQGFSEYLKSTQDREATADIDIKFAILSTLWRDEIGVQRCLQALQQPETAEDLRIGCAEALIKIGDEEFYRVSKPMLEKGQANSSAFRGKLISALSQSNDDRAASSVMAALEQLEPELLPRAIEMLTGRVSWSKLLLKQIGAGTVPANMLNANQVRKLMNFKDEELQQAVLKNWGSIRTTRDPARENLITDMRKLIRATKGDALKGEIVYTKLCGQCHKIHGKGEEVGPDITGNGRGSFEQLLSNVFDPSLVIGSAYQAHNVVTIDGLSVSGLLVEDSDSRVVLKGQGGKLSTVARKNIDEMYLSELSLMPEGIEKQLLPEEIADLFAFLTLDKHPSDPEAQLIAGTREVRARDETNPDKYQELTDEVIPGWSCKQSGELGVGLLAEHFGRGPVLRTHPVDRGAPCVLSATYAIPAEKDKLARLSLSVSHDERGDWDLIVKVNGQQKLKESIGKATTLDGWADFNVDLREFAGQEIKIELLNQPTGWSNEFAYWGKARIEVEQKNQEQDSQSAPGKK